MQLKKKSKKKDLKDTAVELNKTTNKCPSKVAKENSTKSV